MIPVVKIKLKVLMISGTFYPDINGTVIAVANMMEALKDRGHSVCLLTRAVKTSSPHGEWNGIEIIRAGPDFGGLLGRFILAINQFRRGVHLLRGGFHVLHANGFNSLIVALVLGKLFRVPVVASFHGFQRLWSSRARWRWGILFTLTYPIERSLLGGATINIFQSRTLYDAIRKTYNVKENMNAKVISNSVNISTYRFSETSKKPSPNVLFVGSLIRVHGADLLIEAIPHVIEQIHQARLIIVGGGPLLGYLRELMDKLDVSSSVSFMGPIFEPHRLAQLYAESGVVVIPLRYRGYILSLVALEAMAIGRPVVTTMTLDADLSNHGVYMVEADPKKIARTIFEILKMDHGKYSSISRSARDYVERYCTQQAVGTKIEEIYLQLIIKNQP